MLKQTIKGALSLFKESCLENIAEFSSNRIFRAGVLRIIRPAMRFIWLELAGIALVLGFLLFLMWVRP